MVLCVCAYVFVRYVWLGATSSFKAESDLAKYEKARKLKDYIDTIRKNYTAEWDSTDLRKKQVGAGIRFVGGRDTAGVLLGSIVPGLTRGLRNNACVLGGGVLVSEWWEGPTDQDPCCGQQHCMAAATHLD